MVGEIFPAYNPTLKLLLFPKHFQGDLPNADVDPFYENQINHSLIGVANLYLEVLFHDVKLSYHVPIISQQGEVAGRLLVSCPIRHFVYSYSFCIIFF